MVAPTRLVSEVLPGKGYQTEQSLVNITNALNRLQAVAAPGIRVVDLTNSNDVMQTTDNNGTVIFTASGAAASFTFLPTVTMLTSIVRLVNNGVNAVTLVPSSSDDTIDTVSIPSDAAYWFQSDGASKWYRIATNASFGATQTYNITNVTTDRAYDANATTLDEIADTLGTLIEDLRAKGIVA